MNATTTPSARYHLLDGIRGIALFNMILYHAAYDLLHIFHLHISWLHRTPGYVWQQSICWTFILLSGMCWSFGRYPWKRGLLVSICGIVISVVTLLFMPSETVWFGILTFLGAAMLFMIPFSRLLYRLPAILGFVGSLLLFFICFNINRGSLGFGRILLCSLPDFLYQHPILIPLGFPTSTFSSSDYFSFFPWIFLYTAGFFLWQFLQQKKSVLTICKHRLFFFDAIGRHSLLLYMLHQPVLMGIFLLINAAFAAN